jgi:hypothetical protein
MSSKLHIYLRIMYKTVKRIPCTYVGILRE